MNKTPVIATAAAALGLLGGYLVGNTGSEERVVFAAAATETEEVASVPDICVVALSRADTAMNYAGQGFQIMTDLFYAIDTQDVEAFGYLVDEMGDLTPFITGSVSTYRQAAEACRELVPAVAG